MTRKDGAEARKERIQKIATGIQASLYKNKDSGYIPFKKTVAMLELETGLTKEKILEYLALLAEADQFEVDFEKDQIRKLSGV
jgi:hypothetical protein